MFLSMTCICLFNSHRDPMRQAIIVSVFTDAITDTQESSPSCQDLDTGNLDLKLHPLNTYPGKWEKERIERGEKSHPGLALHCICLLPSICNPIKHMEKASEVTSTPRELKSICSD